MQVKIVDNNDTKIIKKEHHYIKSFKIIIFDENDDNERMTAAYLGNIFLELYKRNSSTPVYGTVQCTQR